ncbi:hypothetical protein CYLTODRAFT_495374 [Cylindrobasidium torrendii FP15055 ss-10]|uniref:Uncharacterized protein n=1 Tax=Cylindrobasidium torrendii FP15055 ss-10 TaxID=1314674 RepID=A0A0D7AS70_9AGAR|nr:hypothetical protein CYLTODRAFT_495374 [Cylindrobasidium torrendii FP15055 ss-10]
MAAWLAIILDSTMVNTDDLSRNRRLQDKIAKLAQISPDMYHMLIGSTGGWIEPVPDQADEGENEDAFAARLQDLMEKNQIKALALRQWEATYGAALDIAVDAAQAALAGPPQPEKVTPIPKADALCAVFDHLHNIVSLKALGCGVVAQLVPRGFLEQCFKHHMASLTQPSVQHFLQEITRMAGASSDATSTADDGHTGDGAGARRETTGPDAAATVSANFEALNGIDFGALATALQSAPADFLSIDADTLTPEDCVALLGPIEKRTLGRRGVQAQYADEESDPLTIGDWIGEIHDTFCLAVLAEGVALTCAPNQFAQLYFNEFLTTFPGWTEYETAARARAKADSAMDMISS